MIPVTMKTILPESLYLEKCDHTEGAFGVHSDGRMINLVFLEDEVPRAATISTCVEIPSERHCHLGNMEFNHAVVLVRDTEQIKTEALLPRDSSFRGLHTPPSLAWTHVSISRAGNMPMILSWY